MARKTVKLATQTKSTDKLWSNPCQSTPCRLTRIAYAKREIPANQPATKNNRARRVSTNVRSLTVTLELMVEPRLASLSIEVAPKTTKTDDNIIAEKSAAPLLKETATKTTLRKINARVPATSAERTMTTSLGDADSLCEIPSAALKLEKINQKSIKCEPKLHSATSISCAGVKGDSAAT